MRNNRYDFWNLGCLTLRSSRDPAILKRATGGGRVILTVDLDYPGILASLGDQGPGWYY